MINAIIFDFDGTLADSREGIVNTVCRAAAELGYNDVNRDKIAGMIGLSLYETFHTGVGITNDDIYVAIDRYREIYSANAIYSTSLFPYVADTLQYLSSTGIKMAVASGKGRKALNTMLERLNILHHFYLVVSGEDVKNSKPAPDLVFHIMNYMNVSPEQTLVVGDTTFDIKMGHSAGCLTCGVTYGNHSKNRLMAASPDFICDSFDQIIKLLR